MDKILERRKTSLGVWIDKGDMMQNIFSILERFKENIPVNVELLVTSLGIKLQYVLMNSANDNGYLEKVNGTYKIVVNDLSSPNRQRFTIAHELGHYFLHRSLFGDDVGETRMYRDNTKQSNQNITHHHEIQANQFAAELLVPLEKLKEEADSWDRDPVALAKIFKVSPAAMEIRLKSI